MYTLRLSDPVNVNYTEDYRDASVARQMGMDFYFGGNKNLEKVSHDAGVTIEQTKTVLKQVYEINRAVSKRFIKWDVNSIIDYLINTHHKYTKENAVMIYDLTQKVLYRPNKNHIEFTKIATELFLFLQSLLNYLKKEEQVLFPSIKQLISNKISPIKGTNAAFGCSKNAVMAIRNEPRVACKELKRLRKLTHNYMPSIDECFSYKNLFEKMREFENELFLYAYLENNILVPKVLALMENRE